MDKNKPGRSDLDGSPQGFLEWPSMNTTLDRYHAFYPSYRGGSHQASVVHALSPGSQALMT